MCARFVPSILTCGVVLLCPGLLCAGPIESLADREWTSGKGTRLHARLAFFADRTPQSAGVDGAVLLVPSDLRLPPLSVRKSALSAEDRRYIERIESPYGYRVGYTDLRNKPLTYADGEPLPGEYHSYYSRSRAVSFHLKREKFWGLIDLESLSAESIERLTLAYGISPELETPLGTRVPLNLHASGPQRFELKNVPMIKQETNYCVPASATMIARFHGIRTTQHQLAHLSSSASRQHKGTWSGDMANAMESLGFFSQTRLWADLGEKADFKRFETDIMPFIRASLRQDGPLYVSFKPGVYGNRGHGCVIVGYNDHGQGEIYIHNPAGKRETYYFQDFSRKAHEVVRFHWQPPVSGDAVALENQIMAALHRPPVDLTDAMKLLRAAGLKPALRLHGRRDRRDDRFETERWALAQGHRVVESTLAHHPVCLIPVGRDGRIVGWYLIRREREDPKPIVRPFGIQGWGEPGRPSLDSLFKTWSTPVNVPGEVAWDMPIIELDA